MALFDPSKAPPWRRGRGSLYARTPRSATSSKKAQMPERTFSILKPDATRRNLTGKINAVIEDAGLRIVAQRRI